MDSASVWVLDSSARPYYIVAPEVVVWSMKIFKMIGRSCTKIHKTFTTKNISLRFSFNGMSTVFLRGERTHPTLPTVNQLLLKIVSIEHQENG